MPSRIAQTRVALMILVGEDGRVRDHRVLEGEEPFVQTAIRSVRESTFRPVRRHGKTIAAWTSYEVDFGEVKSPPVYWTGNRQTLMAGQIQGGKVKSESGDSILVEKIPAAGGVVSPVFPEGMLEADRRLPVLVNMLVGKDGQVKQAEMVAGPEILRQPALDAARRYAFSPAIYKDELAAVWITYPIDFISREAPSSQGTQTSGRGSGQRRGSPEEARLDEGQQSRLSEAKSEQESGVGYSDAGGWWPFFSVALHVLTAESGDAITVENEPQIQMDTSSYEKGKIGFGEVRLKALIGSDGKAHQVTVAKFEGDESFRQASIECIQRATWHPAIYRGKPISVWVELKLQKGLRTNPVGNRSEVRSEGEEHHVQTTNPGQAEKVKAESGDKDKASAAIPPPSPSSTQSDLQAARTSLLTAQSDLKAEGTRLLAAQSDLQAARTSLLTAQSDLKASRTRMQLTFKAESGDSIVVEKAPRSVRFDYPKHPEAAKKAGLEGTVKVQYLIGTDGRASRIEVFEGGEPFKQAVVEALQAAVWEPAIHQGKPVAVWKTWTCPFQLIKRRSESGDMMVVDQPPNTRRFPKPVYPQAALRDSVEGVVYLNVLVGEDGKVKRAEITKGDERFKQAAMDAAMASAWMPAIRDGKPVSAWDSFAVPFGINRGVPPPQSAFIPVDTQPRPIAMPKPVYPESALRDSLEGVVLLQILIGRDGGVQEVKVYRAEAPKGGEEAFKQAAVEATQKSEWFPATYRDQPVSVWVTYPIRFTLHGGPPPPGARMLEEKGQQPPKSGR